MPDAWLITFVRHGTEGCERPLVDSGLAVAGFKGAFAWTPDRLADLEFYRVHPRLCDRGLRSRDLWKPAVILEQLRAVPPGDLCLFHDAGKGFWGNHVFEGSLEPLFDWALGENGGRLPGVWVPEDGRNGRWTTRACFRRMDCDRREFWDSPQLQTTYSLWRHDEHSLGLLGDWAAACARVYDEADRAPGGGDLPDFVEDRGSQSVLTNLAVARGLKAFGEPYESTIAVSHPASEPVPATDIANLLFRIRDESRPRAAASGGRPRRAPAPSGRLALFTSIPASVDRRSSTGYQIGRRYQERCIESWKACGFEVYSVHFPEDMAEAEEFTGVTTVAARRTDDDSPDDRKPSLRAILEVINDVGADVSGIINADILLFDDPAWVAGLPGHVADSVVVFTRFETHNVDHTIVGGPPWGFDLIFFDRRFTASLTYCGMRVGETWWDYWFPLSLYFAGAKLKHVTDPICLHQSHLVVSSENYIDYGIRFLDWMSQPSREPEPPEGAGRRERFLALCNHRFAIEQARRRIASQRTYDFIAYVLCTTVWAGICRLMRAAPIEMIEHKDPHHRFVTDALNRTIDHLEQERLERAQRGEPSEEFSLVELERLLGKIVPFWRERFPADDGAPCQGDDKAGPSERLGRIVSVTARLDRYWPVAVDSAARNALRWISRKPAFVWPSVTRPREAIRLIERLRRRPFLRLLARLDNALWNQRHRRR